MMTGTKDVIYLLGLNRPASQNQLKTIQCVYYFPDVPEKNTAVIPPLSQRLCHVIQHNDFQAYSQNWPFEKRNDRNSRITLTVRKETVMSKFLLFLTPSPQILLIKIQHPFSLEFASILWSRYHPPGADNSNSQGGQAFCSRKKCDRDYFSQVG